MHVAVYVALDLASDACRGPRIFNQVETLLQCSERVGSVGHVEELHREQPALTLGHQQTADRRVDYPNSRERSSHAAKRSREL